MTDEAIAVLCGDEYLGPLVVKYGSMTIEPAENFYERFVVSVLRQRVMAELTAIKGVDTWTAKMRLPS